MELIKLKAAASLAFGVDSMPRMSAVFEKLEAYALTGLSLRLLASLRLTSFTVSIPSRTTWFLDSSLRSFYFFFSSV